MPTGIHKTTCQCRLCACRRAKKALTESAGAGGTALAPTSEHPKWKGRPPLTPRALDTENLGARARVASWIAMRAQDHNITNAEIARRLGVGYTTIKRDLIKAHKEGWLEFDDQLDRMRYEIVPKVVDNLVHFLNAKDRTVTIETAKGTIFRQFQDAEGIGDAPQTVLALKIEAVDPEQVKVITGQIVGRPRELRE